jgi:type VI secretion system protein ImpE
MTAAEMLRDGNLDDALAALKKEVSRDPANARHRVFLFQLLCVLGDWDRALTQLNVAADLDKAMLMMAETYRPVLQAEALRAEVFQGRRQPMILGEPPQWIGLLIEALRLTATGQAEAGAALREQAFELAPATGGTIDGTAFEWIADADGRFGPVLEALVNGRYYWVPFAHISRIHVEAPADLRDLVWTPCQFVWSNGGDAVGLIPTRYPGSESSDDPPIRLARKTTWSEPDIGPAAGLGQRLLATDAGEYPLMDVRQIMLNAPAGAAAASSDTGAASDA